MGDEQPHMQQVPSKVTEVPGFPYSSFEELVAAVKRNEVFLSVDRSFALQFMRYRTQNHGTAAYYFTGFLASAMFWVGAVAAVFAWSALGPFALLLILVSLVASSVSRPWMGHTPALVALGGACYGWSQSSPWLLWIGGTWFVTYVAMNYVYDYATNLFTQDLLTEEDLLARALVPPEQTHLVPTKKAGVLSRPWPW